MKRKVLVSQSPCPGAKQEKERAANSETYLKDMMVTKKATLQAGSSKIMYLIVSKGGL